MLKRLVDILVVIPGLILLSPLLILLSILIKLDSRGPVFYTQKRVGRFGKDFILYKFRTMKPGSDKKGLLTIGGRDPRITSLGFYLRKYKLDELPQLFNVLNGTMSLVGPRPEVSKYVELYTKDQRSVLSLRPGITDYASLEYFNENDLLANSEDPEKCYIEVVMPAKLSLNRRYMEEAGFSTDMKIILRTIAKLFN